MVLKWSAADLKSQFLKGEGLDGRVLKLAAKRRWGGRERAGGVRTWSAGGLSFGPMMIRTGGVQRGRFPQWQIT